MKQKHKRQLKKLKKRLKNMRSQAAFAVERSHYHYKPAVIPPTPMGKINTHCRLCNNKGVTGWLPRYDWLIYSMVFFGIDDSQLSRGWFRQPCECPSIQRPIPPMGSGRT